MAKIGTTPEQSDRLIKAGLDFHTADMIWVKEDDSFHIGKTFKYSGLTFPIWSLSALLSLIPPYLGEFNDGIDFGFSKAMNGKWYSAHYLQTADNGEVSGVKTVTGKDAVDAAVELVLWLLENKKI